MKMLKLQPEELSVKKIAVVIGLVIVLIVCVWTGSTETSPTDETTALSADVPADKSSLGATSDTIATNPAITLTTAGSAAAVELPPLNLALLVGNNPFVSSANRVADNSAIKKRETQPVQQAQPTTSVSSEKLDLLQWVTNAWKPSAYRAIVVPGLASQTERVPGSSEFTGYDRNVMEEKSEFIPPAPPAVKIQAIMTGHQRAAVLINNRVYFEDDLLDESWKIEAILADRVRFAPVAHASSTPVN